MPKINQEEYEILKGLDDKWKWIAKDDNYGGFIFCFREKPHKDIRKGGWSPDTTQYKCLWDYDLLFQFIQWEDEEPYNIAELIEEYENKEFYDYVGWKYAESEETEVNKDILWAKIKIHEELDSWCGVEGGIDGDGINNVLNILDQLDEPEVLSQKWIDEHRESTFDLDLDEDFETVFVKVEDLQDLLVPTLSEMEKVEITEEQVMEWLDNNDFYDHATAETVLENAVDKGELGYYGTKYSVVEKPTIPRFVADWIEFKKKSRIPYENVLQAIDELVSSSTSKAHDWVLKTSENKDTFARAWLDGFTVEEQKYYVSERDEEYGGFWFLSKNNNGDISIGVNRDWSEVDWDRLKLTEQEIKDYDERYWAFRKPVEEIE